MKPTNYHLFDFLDFDIELKEARISVEGVQAYSSGRA